MSLGIWMRKHTFRRFADPVSKGGYSLSGHKDISIPADVQTISKALKTDTDGDYPLQRLKVFSNDEILTADEKTGRKADLLWFQGKWFECRSSRLSENTMLRHYTCEFIQCLDQPDPPGEGSDEA